MRVTPTLRWTATTVALVLGSMFQTTTAGTPSAEARTQAQPQADAAGPYQIAKRPMPSGRDLETLLPRKVGTFTRVAFPPGTKPSDSEDLNIDYVAGADKVNVGFSIASNAKDAHEGIRTARTESIVELKRLGKAKLLQQAQEAIGPPTSYYKVDDFIAWSRGGYFFYAKANSVAALDAFMKAFPF